MKKKILFSIAFATVLMSNAQSLNERFKPVSDVAQLEVSVNYYSDFLNRQTYELETAHQEVFVLDSVSWVRNYGNKYYYLTPTTQNIKAYNKEKIKLPSDTGKSNFYIMDVELTPLSKNLLNNFGIKLPNYVKNYVKVMLPLVDVKVLKSNNIQLKNIEYPFIQLKKIISSNNQKSLIYSEGFENNTVPGSNLNGDIWGTANCGWKDVSCWYKSGNWSAWCAGNGAACNSCGNDYVNNMSTGLYPKTLINTNGFVNMYFKFWVDMDFNNTGTNDELMVYDTYDGQNWNLLATYNSSSSYDGQGWKQLQKSYVGQILTSWAYSFDFSSNSIGTSYGVYIDDITLEGTQNTSSINELQNVKVAQISPNPSETGEFTINSSLGIKTIKVMDVTGRNVKDIYTADTSSKTNINLSSFEKGIYFLNIEYFNNKYEVVKVIYSGE